MKKFKVCVVTNSEISYSSEIFECAATDPVEVLTFFMRKHGVSGTGLTFACSYPKDKFVFIPTEAVSSVELMEYKGA